MPEKWDFSEIEERKKFEMNEKEHNILEVGCGLMPFFILHADEKIVDLGKSHYVGLEMQEGKTELIKNYLEKIKSETKFDFVTGRGEKMPFKEKIFDEVLFTNFFGDPHIFKKHKFIDEAFRVLKDGGKMIVIETYSPEFSYDFFSRIGFDSDKRFSQTKLTGIYENLGIRYSNKRLKRADRNSDSFITVYDKISEEIKNK